LNRNKEGRALSNVYILIEVNRPYRVPVGVIGCALVLIPNCLFLLFVMILASYQTILVCLITLLAAFVTYKSRSWCVEQQYSEVAETDEEDST